MPSPVAAAVVLTDEERARLEAWARRPKSAQALAMRARIVLAGVLSFVPYVGTITGFVTSMGLAFGQFSDPLSIGLVRPRPRQNPRGCHGRFVSSSTGIPPSLEWLGPYATIAGTITGPRN